MAYRKSVRGYKSKRIFDKYANRTNTKNLASKQMKRGGSLL